MQDIKDKKNISYIKYQTDFNAIIGWRTSQYVMALPVVLMPYLGELSYNKKL